MKDNSPNDLGPLDDVWTLVNAFTDAMNLRHLRGALYADPPRPVPHRLSDPQLLGQTTSFDPRLAYFGLQRAYVNTPVQNPRAKIDVSP
jgi:hypothetical protein